MRNLISTLAACAALIVVAAPFVTAQEEKKPETHTVAAGPFRISVSLDGVFEAEQMTEVILRPEEWSSLVVYKAVSQGSKAAAGEPLVSFAENIAGPLDLTIGDTVTVNVFGRNVEARIANLRSVDWDSLAINFVVVFSPNTFRGAPHAHLATLSLPEDSPPGLDRGVLRMVTAQFPGVTTIRVRDALEAVSELIGDLALAIRVAASLALVISMLVLGGALAAGHRQRRQDAVILKALGATRRRLLGAFSLEYGLLGVATAIFAVAAGGVAAWYVVTQVMRAEFTFLPGVAVAAAVVALAVTLGLGLAGTWRILSIRAAAHLRNL